MSSSKCSSKLSGWAKLWIERKFRKNEKIKKKSHKLIVQFSCCSAKYYKIDIFALCAEHSQARKLLSKSNTCYICNLQNSTIYYTLSINFICIDLWRWHFKCNWQFGINLNKSWENGKSFLFETNSSAALIVLLENFSNSLDVMVKNKEKNNMLISAFEIMSSSWHFMKPIESER